MLISQTVNSPAPIPAAKRRLTMRRSIVDDGEKSWSEFACLSIVALLR